MKKILAIVLAIFMIGALFTGCGQGNSNNSSNNMESNSSVENKDTSSKNDNKKDTDNKSEENNNKEADAVSGASKKEQAEEIHFDKIPEKVVTGTWGITEVVNELGIEIAGMPSVKFELPDNLKDLPEIGLPMTPDIELLKSVEPDIFITDSTLKNSLEKEFKNQNIPTAFVSCSGYDDMINTILSLGKAFDKEEKANSIIANMKQKEAEAIKMAEGKEKPKVMIIFGTPKNFMLATKYSFAGNVLEKVGGINITSELENVKGPYIPFSIENAINTNPDIILRLTHVNPEQSKKMFEKEFKENTVWQALDAVQNGKVYYLDNKYFGVVANIRCADALKEMAKILYE